MRTGMRTRAIAIGTAALIPVLVLAGCSGKGNENESYNHQGTADTAATAATTGASTGAASTSTTSGGEVAANPGITSWNDNNIVAHLADGDKGEVTLAKLAESRAIIPSVRDYAKMLVTDHSKGEREVRSLESKAKLPAKPASDDTTAKANQDLLKQFTAMPRGKDWDSTWVQHEYDDHQHDIADTKAMQNQAKDARLKQLLGNELPVLQKHLDAAQKLLGNTPGGSSAWHNQEFRKTGGSTSAKSSH